MKKISPKTVSLVKRMLPALREEVKKDFGKWTEYIPDDDFHSNKKVIEMLPFAAHEYLLVTRSFRADKAMIIEWFNLGIFNDFLDKIIAHALRRLAIKRK